VTAPPDRASGDWIPVNERLPELYEPVALINVNRWENCAGDMRRNIQDTGYLSEGPYWSVRGERAQALSAYTHWIALPASPVGDKAQREEVGK
jgi:hypothetical protein